MLRASLLASSAGLMLAIGSSLEVWPVAGLPAETLDAGGQLAIVTMGETPYDEVADVKLLGRRGGGAGGRRRATRRRRSRGRGSRPPAVTARS